MLIPKGEAVELGKRVRLSDLIAELQDNAFTGYVEVSYKLDEISRGQILLRNGDVVAAAVTKLRSRREFLGDDALDELMTLETCVADIYALPDEKVEKAIAWNRKALVGNVARIEVEVRGAVSEKRAEIDREKLLERYGIREPSPEEVDAIIESVFKEPLGDVGDVKRLIEQSFGKLGKRLLEIVDKCSSVEELAEVFPEIEKEAKKLTLFVPRKKFEEVLEKIRELTGL